MCQKVLDATEILRSVDELNAEPTQEQLSKALDKLFNEKGAHCTKKPFVAHCREDSKSV